MAVQKNKTSRSKRDSRRGHDSLKRMTLSTDQKSGETHLRHHLTADGQYRGKQMIAIKKGTEEIDEST